MPQEAPPWLWPCCFSVRGVNCERGGVCVCVLERIGAGVVQALLRGAAAPAALQWQPGPRAGLGHLLD